jgi:hypothetical protein
MKCLIEQAGLRGGGSAPAQYAEECAELAKQSATRDVEGEVEGEWAE